MLAALDVDYRDDGSAVAGVVLFAAWTDAAPSQERAVRVREVAEYEPGAFYVRELPCLLAALAAVESELDAVIVDGHVWLGAERPGLGAHLYEALGRRIPVIGVAKSAFTGAPAQEVLRGDSARPLYVTAAGLDPAEAARRVRDMAGEHRLPTLLKRVDRLARDADPG